MNSRFSLLFYFSTVAFTTTAFIPSTKNFNINSNTNSITKRHFQPTQTKSLKIPPFTTSIWTSTTISHCAKKSNESEEKQQQAETAAKQQVLQGVLNQIERSYGRGSILKLDQATNMVVSSISSGSLTLDLALGGGYPRGRVVEIYGPESSGKTTLALHAIAEAQKNNGIAAFIDAEHALDPEYAKSLGVDVKELYVSQPDCGEMALDVVDKLVRSSAVDVIVVDSVAALVPRAELEGDMTDQQIGLQARLMSKALRKITGSLAASQCTVIFLNQLRSKVGVIYGSPEVTSGGNALKFYSSIRLDTRRKEVLPDNIGIRCKVKVVKNKISTPFKAVMLDIIFGSGIDQLGCLIDAAVEQNVIVRKGSWYSWKNENFAQGRKSACEYLAMEEHLEMRKEIDDMVRQALIQDIVDGKIVDTEINEINSDEQDGMEFGIDAEVGVLE